MEGKKGREKGKKERKKRKKETSVSQLVYHSPVRLPS
jgi:hypothetical protein